MCSLNIVFFLKNLNFLNSGRATAALVFYLPGACTHTDTEGKPRKARVRNIFEKSEKNTILNEHSEGYNLIIFMRRSGLSIDNLSVRSDGNFRNRRTDIRTGRKDMGLRKNSVNVQEKVLFLLLP